MKTIIILFFVLFQINFLNAQQCGSCNNRVHTRLKLLSKEGLSIDTSVAKINGIYYVQSIQKGVNNGNATYYFYRFFNNGRVFISCRYCSFPDSIQLNNLNYGVKGLYRVTNNIVKIESYAPSVGYYFSYFRLNQSNLIYDGSSIRTFSGENNREQALIPFIIHYFECNLISQPSW
jgi:hypothetical protein